MSALMVGDTVLSDSDKLYRVAFVNTGHNGKQCVIKAIKNGKEWGPLRYADPMNLRRISRLPDVYNQKEQS